jgi:hypothetical protein
VTAFQAILVVRVAPAAEFQHTSVHHACWPLLVSSTTIACMQAYAASACSSSCAEHGQLNNVVVDLNIHISTAGVLGAEQLDIHKTGATAAVPPVQQSSLVTAVQSRDPGDPDPFIPLPEVRAAVQHVTAVQQQVVKQATLGSGPAVQHHKPLDVTAKVSEVSSQATRSESLTGRPLRKLLGR